MRRLTEIIVHCAATRPDWLAGRPLAEKVAAIRDWHVKGNGWADIGYHFVIDRDGAVAPGRPVEKVGAHVKGRNANTIGVCLIGGHGSAETDKFADHFAPAQDAALRKLIRDLNTRHGFLALSGHNQFAAKACPGFNVADWWAAEAAPLPPDVEPPAARAAREVPAPDLGSLRWWVSLFPLLARLFGR